MKMLMFVPVLSEGELGQLARTVSSKKSCQSVTPLDSWLCDWLALTDNKNYDKKN